MTVKTSVIQTFLREYRLPSIPLSNNQQLSIIDNINTLSFCKRHHYAAFVRDQGLLVIWEDDPTQIIARAEHIEKYLVDMLWAVDSSDDEHDVDHLHRPDRKQKTAREDDLLSKGIQVHDHEVEKASSSNSNPSLGDDIEEGDLTRGRPRKTVVYQAFLVAFVAMLTIFCLSIGWRKIAIEVVIDGSYTRLAILAAAPFQLWLAWFFFTTMVNGVAQMIGPVRQMTENSKFYSALPPVRLTGEDLPHVTIQCPVFKEGLDSVIHPTITSIKKAMSTYELQGGSASIFINDDGMQLLPEDDARRRQHYYENNDIGWIARPRHAPKGDEHGQNVFVRAGKFKKASNMNFCLHISTRVEDVMAQTTRTPEWNQEDEDVLYAAAFRQVMEEDRGRTWGGGNVRVGDYILLVDSDTRVPDDCLLDAVSEMEASPEVAIIQFSSGVLNVTTGFFERAITFFTHLVYTAIRFAVANGDVAAFVGHNAMLRWAAVQDLR